MKRTNISLECIAERNNLLLAFHKAASGKRFRRDVQAFMQDLDASLSCLGHDIRIERLPYGRFRRFQIFDPKKRLIHAACFEDRVFHHALMNLAGDGLERVMLSSSYACRPGKEVHRAVKRVQKHLRQYAFYGKIDIDGYFASIDHYCLMQVLSRRFKGNACIAQLQRIVDSYQSTPQRGLPMGSLTSQYFANYYLDGLDRLLDALPEVRAHLRYMDDIIWWCDSKQTVINVLRIVKNWLQWQRDLKVKNNVQIQSSQQGVTYCGFRILLSVMRLSRRRKRRYQQRRQYWEYRYLKGDIDATQLQQLHAAVHAITAGTDSLAWRQANLRNHPSIEV